LLTQRHSHAASERHFARYGLAMEYSKQGDLDRGWRSSPSCSKPIRLHSGILMAAQTLVRADRPSDAKTMLTDGIASAAATGNLHCSSEMEAMLAELDSFESHKSRRRLLRILAIAHSTSPGKC